MIDIQPITTGKAQDASHNEAFQVQGFPIVIGALIGPLLAILHKFTPTAEALVRANADLTIGLENMVGPISDDKTAAVEKIEYGGPGYSSKNPKPGSLLALEAQLKTAKGTKKLILQKEIQVKQQNIDEIKQVDDANISQLEGVAQDTDDKIAVVLAQETNIFKMGQAVINKPIQTVADLIASLGQPQN